MHISVKNHAHALENPVAHLRKDVSFEKAASGMVIADPLTLYDCPTRRCGLRGLASADVVRRLTDTPVWMRGSGAAPTISPCTTGPARPWLLPVRLLPRLCSSGITASDLDLVEVHDCFTVAELLATEDLGLTNAVKAAFSPRR